MSDTNSQSAFERFRAEFRKRWDGDEDGLSFAQEQELGTSDGDKDTDGDGIDDADEVAIGSNPTVADADQDPDGDGLTNAQEAKLGTRVDQADSDDDGLTDAREAELGTDPTNRDSDGDELTDGFEVNQSKTNPLRRYGEDGVDDAFRDPDGDGSPHLKEQIHRTDPLNPISDPDSGKTDGGETIDSFLQGNLAEARDTIAKADAREAEARKAEIVEDGDFHVVTDPDEASKATHSAADSFWNFKPGGKGIVFDDKDPLAQGANVEDLPDGATIANEGTWGRAQVEGRSNLARDGDHIRDNDVVDLRRRKQQADDETDADGPGEVVVPPGARSEPPPGGEREPEGWDEYEGEGEAEDAAAAVGDPTSMGIDKTTPEVEGAGVSLEDLLAGRSDPPAGARTSGADLAGSAPTATPDDGNPLDKAVDPDEVIESRLGRGGVDDGSDQGGTTSTGTDDHADQGAGGFERSRLDDILGGPATGDGFGGDQGVDTDTGGASTGEEPQGKEPVDPPAPEPEGEGASDDPDPVFYTQDGNGNWIDSDGNLVDPSEVPGEQVDPEDGDGSDGTEAGSEADGSGVSTSVDPDGGTGDRSKGEKIEAELGAPTGRPRQPIDPVEGEPVAEGDPNEIPRHLITTDDLAQPDPDGIQPVGGSAPQVDHGATSGRGGKNVIDYGPDHVTHETGQFLDPDVPSVTRSEEEEKGGGTAAAEATPDVGRVGLPDGVTADVDHPAPLRAVTTDGREQGLQPDEGDEEEQGDPDTATSYEAASGTTTVAQPDDGSTVTWSDPADDVPPIPEVVDDGFTDDPPDRFEPEPGPEPQTVEPEAEPDRFDAPDLL